MQNVPAYVSITFILTTFLAIGFLFHAFKQSVYDTTPAKIVYTATAFWIIFTTITAISGFFLRTDTLPPRFIFAPLPPLLLIIFLFVFYRETFIEKLPLKILTMLHIVRIPVAVVLYWLWQNGQVPPVVTFEIRNFDILAGITAPFIYWLAFRNNSVNRPLLLGWNFICLLLLINIVVDAVFPLPTSLQQFGLNQPNVAVLYFPYLWLPAIVVPIVLFAHLVSLWQLLSKSHDRK